MKPFNMLMDAVLWARENCKGSSCCVLIRRKRCKLFRHFFGLDLDWDHKFEPEVW